MITGYEAAGLTGGILILEYVVDKVFQKYFPKKKSRLMTFWGNWAASYGMLIFAAINLVIFPDVIQNHHWFSHLIAFILGALVTLALFRDWKSKPWQNSGHIIGPEGEIELAGWLHAVYMTAQAYAIVLFIITPYPAWKVCLVGALFIVFIAIQQTQSVIVQGGDKGKAKITAAWQLAGTVGIAAAKIWWL